jgi:hypothetical protein
MLSDTSKTRLADLPGMAPGIVGVREDGGRKFYTLQCERCFKTEEPKILVLMTFHFHARSRKGENPRLCRDCRLSVYSDCTCYYCVEDRRS